MEEHNAVFRKANSVIRNRLFLELELEELVTKGSFMVIGEVVKKYTPKVYEACQHSPMQIIYDELENQIENIDEIKKVIKSTKAKGYILGEPVCSDYISEDEEEFFVANFPINFYKLRSS